MLEFSEKEDVTMTSTCAVMGRWACNTPKTKHSDKKMAKVFDQIANGIDPSEKKQLSVDHSLAIQVRVANVVADQDDLLTQ